MNHAEYSAIPALNWSTLKKISVSPAYLRHCIDHPEEDADKASFRQGRATHCATLEPERFLSDYVVEPDFDQVMRDKHGSLRTKAAREERDEIRCEWNAKNMRPEVELISQEEFDTALRCAHAIRASKIASKYMEGAKFEQIIRWHDPDTGIECKGRIDIQNGRIVDLKTTRRSTVREILRDAAQYDYHGQVAWYHDGAVLCGIIDGETPPAMIAVSCAKDSTFVDVTVLDMALTPWVMDSARELYKRLINLYAGCLASDYWPGMAPQIEGWTIPDWKMNENQEEEF